MDTWVVQQLRRSLRNELVAWGIVGLLFIVAAGYFANYLKSYFNGPFPMSGTDLLAIQSSGKANGIFAQVSGTSVIETGVQQITVRRNHGTETGRWVSGNYYALLVGSKFLIVKAPTGSPLSLQGELGAVPSDLYERLFPSAEAKVQAREEFYPFYLDGTSDFKTIGHWIIGISSIILVYGIWRVVVVSRKLATIMDQPLIKRVQSWNHLVMASTWIEAEFNSSAKKKFGSWYITHDFLIRKETYAFDVLRIRDLLWAYKKVTTHKTNFVETGKSYGLVLLCYGGRVELSGPEIEMEVLLEDLLKKAPWAVSGYSPELLQIWNKSNREFCQEVERRRQAAVAGA